jgi:hypothetical protein
MQCNHCMIHDHVPYSATLTRNAPEAPYTRRVRTNVLHFGQLKLLLSEIQFLRHIGDWHGCTLVYAGASPGLHLPILLRMFPGLNLVLVDPNPSCMENSARIRIMQQYMTDDLANMLAAELGQNILFVSDIRIGGEENETDNEQQARIQRDMDSQMRWHSILSPKASLMKFRLPWNCPYTWYGAGIIYLPIYGKRLTHESRLLITRGARVVKYDNQKHERQMAFFNQVTRHATYPGHKCFDCYTLQLLVGDQASTILDELSRASLKWAQTHPARQ